MRIEHVSTVSLEGQAAHEALEEDRYPRIVLLDIFLSEVLRPSDLHRVLLVIVLNWNGKVICDAESGVEAITPAEVALELLFQSVLCK